MGSEFTKRENQRQIRGALGVCTSGVRGLELGDVERTIAVRVHVLQQRHRLNLHVRVHVHVHVHMDVYVYAHIVKPPNNIAKPQK